MAQRRTFIGKVLGPRARGWLAHGGRWALLGALGGCVEPYAPAVVDAPNSFLVVDGFINGNGVTRINLARTANVAVTTAPPAEKGAKVFVVDDAGVRYPLTEQASGTYRSDSLVLSPARRYQVRITTAANAAYESDLVLLKVTPPIDRLGWRIEGGDQLQLLLSTHDGAQASRYYRWGLAETWEFTAAYESFLEYDRPRDILVERTTPIYRCWRTERLSAIKQGSSAQLSQDALADVPLLRFPLRAERFKVRYSLFVSQYAETAEEFAYNELLRKNTESVGGVNDPLPAQLTGNVHRVGAAAEPVLGFVGAHTVVSQRLFIGRAELPPLSDAEFENPDRNCSVGEEKLGDTKNPIFPPHTRIFSDISNTPLQVVLAGADTTGYTGSSRACVDCRLRGANVRPAFW